MLDDTKTTIWNKREERWREHQDEDNGATLFSSIPNTIQCLAKAHYRLVCRTSEIEPTNAPLHFYSHPYPLCSYSSVPPTRAIH